MNLNSLRIFAMVARHGNLQRAAEALNLTRGAVSQRIRQLEIDLGVTLLERQARGVALTPEGQRCAEAVEQALGTLESALTEMGEGSGRITLHLGSSTAAKWLMPRMARLTARFPRLQLSTEVHERLLTRALARNEIALWPGRIGAPAPFRRTLVLTDLTLMAVCSPDLPRPEGPLPLDTLLTLPLLQDSHRRWEALIARSPPAIPPRLLNFDRSALALDAAIEGHGVAIAPRHIVEHDLQRRRLVRLWTDPEPPAEQLFVSWSDAHIRQPEVPRLVDWIAAEFAPS